MTQASRSLYWERGLKSKNLMDHYVNGRSRSLYWERGLKYDQLN